jgi:hypothetical protein
MSAILQAIVADLRNISLEGRKRNVKLKDVILRVVGLTAQQCDKACAKLKEIQDGAAEDPKIIECTSILCLRHS